MRRNGFLSPIGLCRIFALGLLLTNVGCCVGTGWIANRSGIRQYNRGHYAQARHRFTRAVAHDPCNPDYRHNLAMAIQKQGDAGACEQILRHNLTIDAMHQPSYHSLAQLMVTQGRAPEAQELVSTWAATQPYVPEANIEMAWIQRETGDLAGADQSLQTALRADPSNPIALAHLGQLHQGAGHPDEAVAYYQRSLNANWNQPEVQSRLATLIEPGPVSRSALMQNRANQRMMAGGSMGIGDPMMAGTPMMTASSPLPFGQQAMAFNDVNSNTEHRRRRRHRGMENESIVSTYPVPSFDASASNWVPAGTIGGSSTMTAQAPSLATDPVTLSQINLPPLGPPQFSDHISTQNVSNGNSPTLIGLTDPAHASDNSSDVTASLPVVDPH